MLDFINDSCFKGVDECVGFKDLSNSLGLVVLKSIYLAFYCHERKGETLAFCFKCFLKLTSMLFIHFNIRILVQGFVPSLGGSPILVESPFNI